MEVSVISFSMNTFHRPFKKKKKKVRSLFLEHPKQNRSDLHRTEANTSETDTLELTVST